MPPNTSRSDSAAMGFRISCSTASSRRLISSASFNGRSIQERINRENLPLKMMLQVHDELVFECPKDRLEELSAMVKAEMECAMELKVPLVASVGSGENWLLAH